MYFQQLLQERDEVCPFLHIIEGVETFVYLLRVLLELWIGCVGWWDMRSYYVTDHWNVEYVQSIVFESHIPSSLDLPTLLEVLADIVAPGKSGNNASSIYNRSLSRASARTGRMRACKLLKRLPNDRSTRSWSTWTCNFYRLSQVHPMTDLANDTDSWYHAALSSWLCMKP